MEKYHLDSCRYGGELPYTSIWWNNTIWTAVGMVENYHTPPDGGIIPSGYLSVWWKNTVHLQTVEKYHLDGCRYGGEFPYTSIWWNNTIWTAVGMVEEYHTPADSRKIPFGWLSVWWRITVHIYRVE